MLTAATLEHILDTLPQRRVGLIGDLFLDRYLDIDATLTEPSIETGLDAYQVVGVRAYPGALGTVINNLVALGVGQIVPLTMVGDDGEGYELRQALSQMPGVSAAGLVACRTARTPTYTKPMRSCPGQVAEELNRLDIKNRRPLPIAVETELIRLLHEHWHAVDAWIILDQVSERNCGVITDRIRDEIRQIAERDLHRLALADSRELITEFRGVSIKPNAREASQFAGGPIAFARELNRTIYMTRGEDGIDVIAPDGTLVHVPSYPVAGPIDIVGAGDSTSAGIVAAKMSGLTDTEAAAFGNLVASITIQQLGTTGSATPLQVRQRFAEVQR